MRKYILVFVTILLTQSVFRISINAQVLNVPKVIQEQTEWCWAATTKCVLDYFGYTNSQCTIADYTRSVATWHSFGTTKCCQSASQGCNYWNYNWGYSGSIQDILSHFGSIKANNIYAALSSSEIQSEITNGRPFVIRWGWNTGGGHFVIGHGISGTDIYFMNPLPGYGLEIANYNWVVNDGSHVWTHSQTFCMPATPGSITGNTSVCKNSTQVYKISGVPGATGYEWKLPTGWSGSSNQTSITVLAGSSNGKIYVTATNTCGKSIPQSLSITIDNIDSSVSQDGIKLTANATQSSYQWITCPEMKIINGETNQSFIATQNGNYSVIITKNNCSDTSNCYAVNLTSTKNNEQAAYLTVYPNPTEALLNIHCNGLIEDTYYFMLTDMLGQIQIEKKMNPLNHSIEMQFDLKSLNPGMYFLSVCSSGKKLIRKIIKQ